MPYIKVNPSVLSSISETLRYNSSKVGQIESDFSNIARKLDWDVRSASDIQRQIDRINGELEGHARMLGKMQVFIGNAKQKYESVQQESITRGAQSRGADSSRSVVGSESALSTWQKFRNEFQSNYGVGDMLAGGKYIKDVYGFTQDIKGATSWKDIAKTSVDVYQFLSGAGTTFNNYLKIGNAVGKTKALTWWAKSVTGLKPLGRASTAKNPFMRFKNNLINKTSPFNAQLRNVAGNFTGANGVGKAVASWATVAADGVLNFFSNKDEQAQSNGTMSDGRVWAETITETAVGTVLTYGAGIVVGAAITALAPVSLPGIFITAVSGAAIAGINAGISALTGKSVTEWASDSILDAGLAIGQGVKQVAKSAGNWFGKLAFA